MTTQTTAELGMRRIVQILKSAKRSLIDAINVMPPKAFYVSTVTGSADTALGSTSNPYQTVAAAIAAQNISNLRVIVQGSYTNTADNITQAQDNLLIVGSTGISGGYDTTIGSVSSNGKNRLQVRDANIGVLTISGGTGHKLERVNLTASGNTITLANGGFANIVGVDFASKGLTLSVAAGGACTVYLTDCSNVNITSIATGVSVFGSRVTGAIANSSGTVGFGESDNLRVTGAGVNLSASASFAEATAKPSSVGLYILNYAPTGYLNLDGTAADVKQGDGIYYAGTNKCVRLFTFESVLNVNVSGVTWVKSAGKWVSPIAAKSIALSSSYVAPASGSVVAAGDSMDAAVGKLQAQITDKINTSSVGAANGIASLGSDGKVPAAQLPSYVDDVVEGTNFAAFPATGETSKIYVAIDTNRIYRWSGSAYLEVSPSAGNADTATKLATARTISATGDATGSMSFDGSANASIALSLASITDAGSGAFKKFTVNSKGLVTGTTAVIQSDITSLLSAGSITNAMLANASVANLSGTNTGDETSAAIKSKLGITTLSGSNTGDQTITLTGDVTGTGTGSFAATLSNSGATAGTYRSVTVDAKGRVTAGTNPTTLAGYGITDALTLGSTVGSAAGTAAAGTSTTAAHSDHVHPLQTSVAGNAGTATKLATAVNINGVAFDGSGAITINAVDSTARVASSTVGAANGVAPLGADAKIADAYIPDFLLGATKFKDTWNAATNTPAIPAASTANKGWYYIVETAGATSISGITDWLNGDWLVSTGTKWVKIDNTEAVSSVNGKRGAVVLTAADVSADAAGSSATALASAKTYADAGDATTLASAKTYSDSKLTASVNSLQSQINAIPAAVTVSSDIASIVCVMSTFSYEGFYRFEFFDGYNASGTSLGYTDIYMAANGTYTRNLYIPARWKSCRIKNNFTYWGSPPSSVMLRNSAGQDILASPITNVNGAASSQIIGNMPTGKYAIAFA